MFSVLQKCCGFSIFFMAAIDIMLSIFVYRTSFKEVNIVVYPSLSFVYMLSLCQPPTHHHSKEVAYWFHVRTSVCLSIHQVTFSKIQETTARLKFIHISQRCTLGECLVNTLGFWFWQVWLDILVISTKYNQCQKVLVGRSQYWTETADLNSTKL